MPVLPPRSRGAPPPFPRPRRARRPPTSAVSEASAAPDVSVEQMQDAWARSVLPAVKERSIPAATLLAEATPTGLDDDTLTLSFPPGAEFHRKQVDDPKNLSLLRDALYEVTGRRLAVVTALAEDAGERQEDNEPIGEQGLISLLVSDLNATEVEEIP